MDEASIMDSLSDNKGNVVDLSNIHKTDKYPKEQTITQSNYIHANDDEDDSSVMITFDT